MGSYLRTALVCLVCGGLAGPAYAADGDKDQDEQARVQSMTAYKSPLQRYTVKGIQRDPGPDPASPATQEIVYQNALAQGELYSNKYADICAPDCDKCCHFYLEGGFYYMKPLFESNPAFVILHRQVVNGVPTVGSSIEQLGYDANFAPRVSFGVSTESELLGLRTTWWHFDERSHQRGVFNTDPTLNTVVTTPEIFGVPGFTSPGTVARTLGVFNDVMLFGSHIDTHVWDWEATHRFHLGEWCLLLSEGVRYTYLSQSYQALRSNRGTGRLGTARVNLLVDRDLVGTGHNINGAGPTAALEFRRALGDWGIALYGSGRCSVTFGRGRTQSFHGTQVTEQIIPRTGRITTNTATATSFAVKGHDDVMPVSEVELGLEWAHKCGPARVFVKTGLIASEWDFAGSATGDNGDLAFFGLNCTLGLDF
jgi:hypothetical protein